MRLRVAKKIALQQYGAHVYKAPSRWFAGRRYRAWWRRQRLRRAHPGGPESGSGARPPERIT